MFLFNFFCLILFTSIIVFAKEEVKQQTKQMIEMCLIVFISLWQCELPVLNTNYEEDNIVFVLNRYLQASNQDWRQSPKIRFSYFHSYASI